MRSKNHTTKYLGPHLATNLTQESKQRVKDSLMQTVKRTPQDSPIAQQKLSLRTLRYSLVPIILAALTTGTGFASANSTPGDTLYPVKRFQEKVQLTLTTSPDAKTELQVNFAKERVKEYEALESKAETTIKAGKLVPQSLEVAKTLSEKEIQTSVASLDTAVVKLEAAGKVEVAKNLRTTILDIRKPKKYRAGTEPKTSQDDQAPQKNQKQDHKQNQDNSVVTPKPEETKGLELDTQTQTPETKTDNPETKQKRRFFPRLFQKD